MERDTRYVMAGRVPANHVFARRAKDVVGRHKGGHDDWCVALQLEPEAGQSLASPVGGAPAGYRLPNNPDGRHSSRLTITR